MGYCHAEAKSVPDPIARLRQTTIRVGNLQPARLEYQNS